MSHIEFGWSRSTTTFESCGTECAAWLYRPEESIDPPIVVMAHGFGLTRRMGLATYAERFAERGIAVLVFDYRGFGHSNGEHRNIVDPSMHLADWKAAVEHVRDLSEVDGSRLGVWGTSFSAGHAFVTAAHSDVTAYVGQVPYYGDPPSLFERLREQGIQYMIRVGMAGIRDQLRSQTARPPYYVPLVGQPGESAPINAPGAEAAYRTLVPNDIDETDWNRCAARIFMLANRYKPREHTSEVDCPAFIFEATRDQLVSSDAITEVVKELDDVECLQADCDHFDVYDGRLFEEIVDHQSAFFEKHLLGQ